MSYLTYIAASLEEHTNGWEDDGEDDLDDVAGEKVSEIVSREKKRGTART